MRTLSNPSEIQGLLHLKWTLPDKMLWMSLLELAPWNIGKEKKRYDHAAGCLIAYACRKSFDLNSNYNGYLLFQSKTALVNIYRNKYKAKL